MVAVVEPSQMDELTQYDMTHSNEVYLEQHWEEMDELTQYDITRSNEVYLEQHRGEILCHNCNQPGHKASQCQAPRDPSRPAPVRPRKAELRYMVGQPPEKVFTDEDLDDEDILNRALRLLYAEGVGEGPLREKPSIHVNYDHLRSDMAREVVKEMESVQADVLMSNLEATKRSVVALKSVLACQLPRHLAFVRCDNEELMKSAYKEGSIGALCFEKPSADAAQTPSGWHYRIWPALPQYEYPGNLVLEVNRPIDDKRVIVTDRKPSPSMAETQVWAFPETSDLAVRRLINCVNEVVKLDLADCPF
ncbi:MAG: hypothetical protein Q9213_008375 [Squamulea squamosa]